MSVVLGIIHDDKQDSLFVRDLVRLIREREAIIDGVIFVGGGQGRLDNARNEVVRRFLTTKSKHLLTIDTDMTFLPEDLDALFATRGDVRSGIYFVDSHPVRPAMANITDGFVKAPTDWEDGTINVDYCGAGFMLIDREVLEALGPEPYRQDHASPSGALLGEDYALCHRVREAGFSLTVNTKVFLGHVKPRVLGAEA